MFANNAFTFFNNGRPAQINAVLAFIGKLEGIDISWDGHRHIAEPSVDHWDVDRSHGVVVTLLTPDMRDQLNIVITTHPVGDHTMIASWEGQTFGRAPTIDNMPEDHPMVRNGIKQGSDMDFSFSDANGAADHVIDLMEKFWEAKVGNLNPPRDDATGGFPGV